MEGHAPVKYSAWYLFAFLIGIALIIWAATCHGATPTPEPAVPTPFDVSQIDFSKFTPEEIAATEKHRDALKGDVKQAQNRQAQVIADQGSSIAEVKVAAEETQKSFDKYRAAAETQINKGNQAIAALDHVLKKLHLAKWILCGIWVALCALVATKIPPPIGLYVSGGLGVAGVTFIWLWI